MKLKAAQFCSLATAPSWQAWLYQYDQSIYKDFAEAMQKSTGCTVNKEIMLATLDVIRSRSNGETELFKFLSKNYPYLIEDTVTATVLTQPQGLNSEILEPIFKPTKLLTYPRRIILEDQLPANLNFKVQQFIADKLKYDYAIVNNRAYIEYLTTEDSKILDRIPNKNWLISAYRSKI